MITELIKREIESFAINICQSDHPVKCNWWQVLEKHLLHVRDISKALRDTKRLLWFSEENQTNQLWLFASSLESGTQDMCDYINDILNLPVGGLYYKGYVEKIY